MLCRNWLSEEVGRCVGWQIVHPCREEDYAWQSCCRPPLNRRSLKEYSRREKGGVGMQLVAQMGKLKENASKIRC